jgi:MFS family permease
MLIVLAAALVTIGCIAIALFPTFPIVIGSQILIGIGAAVFPPAIAAITLGLVGRNKLDRRVGRNETFNHSGNLLVAVLAGLIGQFISRKGIFFLVGVMAVASAYSALRIRKQEINHALARGDGGQGKGLDSTVYMSACIIIAQVVMIPSAYLAGRLVNSGRKPVFLVGFAVLPIRGVLYTLSHNPFFLVSGVGAARRRHRLITQNVTNRKQAEAKIIKLNQALNRRVKELQTLLEVIPTGIGIAEDPECRTIRANPALAKLLGIPVDANASLSAPNDERPTNFFKPNKLWALSCPQRLCI